ncbi:MAG: sulfatase-like hydrolase/transferase [Kiritimatiellales bacterium]
MNTKMLCALCAVGTAAAVESATKTPPNVVIILADDQGWADLGIYGATNDVRTPNLDQLARDGALFTSGYITAPQCAPSRAGLITGKYQQRFGFDSIPDGPLPLEEITLAERLQRAGYTTGFVGKWHLEPSGSCLRWGREHCPDRIQGNKVMVPVPLVRQYFPAGQGFDEYFRGEMSRFWINYDLDGKPVEPQWRDIPEFRVDTQTQAALTFIDRNKSKPFFLYLGYFAPHVPLEATKQYLDRFPGNMPERRRYALAMISAMDDGVGAIRQKLQESGLSENTLIFYLSDNGAPLGAQQDLYMADVLPVNKPKVVWDGSVNTPWLGEKGMLMEGGIRVPYIVTWPGTIPSGTVVDEPVISLDVAATVVSAAGLETPDELDGINLLPRLSGKEKLLPKRSLFWRFWNQSAVRSGSWKYICLTDGREQLYDLSTDAQEKVNRIAQHPEKAQALRAEIEEWAAQLQPAGLRRGNVTGEEMKWYEYYLNRAD